MCEYTLNLNLNITIICFNNVIIIHMANISVFVRIRPLLQQEIDTYQQKDSRLVVSPDRKNIA